MSRKNISSRAPRGRTPKQRYFNFLAQQEKIPASQRKYFFQKSNGKYGAFGCIYRGFPDHPTFQGRVTNEQQWLELSKSRGIDRLQPYMKGLVVSSEHADGANFGSVVGAFTHQRDWLVEFEIDPKRMLSDSLIMLTEAGWLVGLSLHHDPVSMKPIELSLCWTGKRENTGFIKSYNTQSKPFSTLDKIIAQRHSKRPLSSVAASNFEPAPDFTNPNTVIKQPFLFLTFPIQASNFDKPLYNNFIDNDTKMTDQTPSSNNPTPGHPTPMNQDSTPVPNTPASNTANQPPANADAKTGGQKRTFAESSMSDTGNAPADLKAFLNSIMANDKMDYNSKLQLISMFREQLDSQAALKKKNADLEGELVSHRKNQAAANESTKKMWAALLAKFTNAPRADIESAIKACEGNPEMSRLWQISGVAASNVNTFMLDLQKKIDQQKNAAERFEVQLQNTEEEQKRSAQQKFLTQGVEDLIERMNGNPQKRVRLTTPSYQAPTQYGQAANAFFTATSATPSANTMSSSSSSSSSCSSQAMNTGAAMPAAQPQTIAASSGNAGWVAPRRSNLASRISGLPIPTTALQSAMGKPESSGEMSITDLRSMFPKNQYPGF